MTDGLAGLFRVQGIEDRSEKSGRLAIREPRGSRLFPGFPEAQPLLSAEPSEDQVMTRTATGILAIVCVAAGAGGSFLALRNGSPVTAG